MLSASHSMPTAFSSFFFSSGTMAARWWFEEYGIWADWATKEFQLQRSVTEVMLWAMPAQRRSSYVTKVGISLQGNNQALHFQCLHWIWDSQWGICNIFIASCIMVSQHSLCYWSTSCVCFEYPDKSSTTCSSLSCMPNQFKWTMRTI